MKIKKYLLALLLSSSAFLMTGSLGAEIVMSAEAAVASGDELAGDYLALLEAQGEYAYAFDFFTTSMLWTVIAAALVFLMHLGFATLEAGLTQSKNTVNILFTLNKNCKIKNVEFRKLREYYYHLAKVIVKL